MKQLNRWLPALALLATLANVAPAQNPEAEARSKRSTVIMEKLIKVELLSQIVPVLLTKDQIRKLLLPVERCRGRIRELEKKEAEEMVRLEPSFDVALKEAGERAISPSRETIDEMRKFLFVVRVRRLALAQENIDEMVASFMANTNAGQRRAAANSLNPKFFNPTAKPEEMTEEQKINLFVTEVLLHPLSYDILIQLSKERPAGS